MRELERELAATLLVRTRNGVTGTTAGMVLYERAVAAERELSQATEQIRQLGGGMTGSLTIGAVPLAVMLLVPEAVRTFSREYPQIQLRVIEELYIAELAPLRKGEVDIALGPLPDNVPSGEFTVEPLMPIAMTVVVRRGNPLARARQLADLQEARWVYTGMSADSGYARVLFERHGLPAPPAGALVNSTLGLLSIIASGNCVGLLPQQIAAHPLAHRYLEVVPVMEGPLQLSLGALAKSGSALKPSVRHFLTHLHRAAHHLSLPT
jgi:DNA-binding transcriptional LysR family regulator